MKALLAAAALLAAGAPAIASAAESHAALTTVQWRHDANRDNNRVVDRRGDRRGHDGNNGDWRGHDGNNGDWRRDHWRAGGSWNGRNWGARSYYGANRFYRGGYLAPAYRGYMVRDYWRWRLHRPPYGYYWYRHGNDYVLAALATGLIAEVVAANAYDNGYYGY
jgi:Ni/Co efflux regulator RcnB